MYAPYRLTDHFDPSNVTTVTNAPSSVPATQPLVWHFADHKVTWQPLRGRVGFKAPGLLVLKGEGSTPVLAAPNNPAIDWSLYEAVKLRMIAEGGQEIKLKLGSTVMRQKLAPAMEWMVYRFDIPEVPSGFIRPLAIMPTDDLYAAVAFDSIELVPRREKLSAPAGVTSIGKQEEYRNTLFARAPASVTFDVPVPAGKSVLRFGLGISGKAPVKFRVLAGPAKAEIFSREVSNPDGWDDAEADLSAYAGTTVRLVLENSAGSSGAVGYWANPLVASRTLGHRPNVLLYVVCTLRPDHMSLYGYGRDTTPFLKKFGEEAVVFDDAVAPGAWTKASVPSILTSLPAITHGLANESDTIPRGALTMAEQLRAAGYVTASVVANPFAGRASGLERGFDYMLEYPVVQRYRTEAVDRGTDSAAINRALMPWLDRHRDEPLFLFVLATDPHAPYRPPAEFEQRFANPAETDQFNRDYARLRDIRAYGGGATVSRDEIRAKGIDPDAFKKRAIDRYDAEIAHNDHSIEALVTKYRELGILDNTLVIVSSDHGEEFWEHGFGAHGHSLYNELIHAALLMWNPKLLPAARRVPDTVQLLDILPTVLDVLGLQPATGAEGRSLAPLLRGEKRAQPQPAMSSKVVLPTARPDAKVRENLTDTIARVEREWKLIYRTQPGKARLKEIELYDRRSDPGDLNDVSAQHPNEAHRMRGQILNWMDGEKAVKARIGQSGARKLDTSTLERLRSLGYLGGEADKQH